MIPSLLVRYRFFVLIIPAASLCVHADTGQYQELTISRAVSMAVSACMDLRALRIKQASAFQQYNDGIREYFPRVGLKYGNLQSVVEGGPDTRTMSIGLTLTQLVFDGGRLGRQRQISAMELSRFEQTRLRTTRELSDQVGMLSRKIELQDHKLDIQKTTIQLALQQAKVARKEFELGSGLEIDAVETELGAQTLESEHAQMQLEMADSRFQLLALLSLPPDSQIRVTTDFDPAYAGRALPEQWPGLTARAKRESDQLAQAELEIRQMRMSLISAQQWYVPTINLEGTVSIGGDRFPLQVPQLEARLIFDFPIKSFPVRQTTSLGGTPSQKTDSSFSGTIGLFDDINEFSAISSAKAKLLLAQEQRDKLVDEIAWGLERQVRTYNLRVRQLALSRQAIASAEHRNGILNTRLQIGELRRLEYFQAETKLAQDKINLLQSVFELMELERQIERIAGLEPGQLMQLAGDQP